MDFFRSLNRVIEWQLYTRSLAPVRCVFAGLLTFLCGFLIAASVYGLLVVVDLPPTSARLRVDSMLVLAIILCLISPVIENLTLLLGAWVIQSLAVRMFSGSWSIRLKAGTLGVLFTLLHIPQGGLLALSVFPLFFLVSLIMFYVLGEGGGVRKAYLNTVLIHSAHNAFALLSITCLGVA